MSFVVDESANSPRRERPAHDTVKRAPPEAFESLIGPRQREQLHFRRKGTHAAIVMKSARSARVRFATRHSTRHRCVRRRFDVPLSFGMSADRSKCNAQTLER